MVKTQKFWIMDSFMMFNEENWVLLHLDTVIASLANVYAEKKENRMMMTGLHTVADIYFVKCGSYVGWRYEFAFEKNQLYKEGKSILER
ncbi:hypothetical protein YC2023_098410 [Brassica napus]